nr:unnamed protein product [Callosobruchus chinensis]
MICVNFWILWRPNLKNDNNLYLPLSEFKLALAEVLTRANALQRKRERPSTSLQPQLEKKKKKYPFSQVPAHEIRTDNFNHLPVVNGERQRCKYPECKGKRPNMMCEMFSVLMPK